MNDEPKAQIELEEDPFLDDRTLKPWQRSLNDIIFGVDSRAGRLFDVGLLVAIIISVVAVMLESVTEIRERWGLQLYILEWILTLLFTAEYLLRIACVRHPFKYVTSFFGVVDLLSILPTYLSLFFGGTQSLIVIRALRLVRVFRVLKIAHCLREADHLWVAMKATQGKIMVFLVVVLSVVLIMGSAMYLIEGPEYGFTNIPRSVYWAIVTMTTVGYGDIAPQTVYGQILASIAMILGYAIIIVPTGVFSVEVVAARHQEQLLPLKVTCGKCGLAHHEFDAQFCRKCGKKLPDPDR